MARVIWAPNALADLESLLEYIARDAPQAARRFAEQLVDRVEVLAQHPLLGSFVPEDDSQTYREIRQGNYRVIYRPDDDVVYVVAVHHASRLLSVDDLS